MPGIQIGDGTIIGTRAPVSRNVEPYAIVGGNPARTIRSRFDEADVELLLEMKWWDWANHRLRVAMPILTSGDIRALHAYWRTFD